MSSDNIAIRVHGISKCYHIYDRPQDRLKQSICPRLQKIFGKQRRNYYREFWALKDISFEVRKGETVGIIGRNGSGKSTLLQIICGTLSPTAGSVETNGRVAGLLELGSGFNPEFTGRENVYMNGAILGLTQAEITSRFEDIAAFADIGEFIERPVKTYSSGMMVRLAFAVSVCVEPDILIVDEALSVGDAAFQFKCLDRLRVLTANGTTFLFVSHDMGMVKNLCHYALYLEKGQERAHGASSELAELYFLDMRDEQRRVATGGKAVKVKPFLGGGNGIAFGTEEGHIISACFTNSQCLFSSYVMGEEIDVRVEVMFMNSLSQASLSLIILDRRMVDVGGKFFLLDGEDVGDGWRRVVITVRFKAILSVGRYHITVRLEDRLSDANFRPIDRQVGLLAFEVIDSDKSVLGTVDLDLRLIPSMRIVALLTVRNEALYLKRCLEHLISQGIETCVIDNESTDASLEIAKEFLGRGVFRIETQPYEGYFDLSAQLRMKEKLMTEIKADWFIHHDADEIREAPIPFKTLREGILAADKEGYNAINFDEFVFLPTEDEESFERTDYVQRMRHYYFFEPLPLRQIKAWKNTGLIVDLASSGGHSANYKDRKIYPVNFIMRHYIVLSKAHAIAKYTRERIYSEREVSELGWHGPRTHFKPENLNFKNIDELRQIDGGTFDKSQPVKNHPFFGAE